jgi:hypothetical protein
MGQNGKKATKDVVLSLGDDGALKYPALAE